MAKCSKEPKGIESGSTLSSAITWNEYDFPPFGGGGGPSGERLCVKSFKVGTLVNGQPPHCPRHREGQGPMAWRPRHLGVHLCCSLLPAGLLWIALHLEPPPRSYRHGWPYQELKLQMALLWGSLEHTGISTAARWLSKEIRLHFSFSVSEHLSHADLL